MKLTNEERKLLTEYLGECWHKLNGGLSGDLMYCRCSTCNKWIHIADIEIGSYQRTFTTITDLHAVYSKIVEKGEWARFYYRMFPIKANIDSINRIGSTQPDFAAWLFCLNCPEQIPKRMKMVSEFIEWGMGRK